MEHLYINNQIADVQAPRRFSLAANPNYLIFDNRQVKNGSKKYFEIRIKKTTDYGNPSDANYENNLKTITEFSIIEIGKTEHLFWGTTNKDKVASNVFMIEPKSQIATIENLRACLQKNSFLRPIFDINIDMNTLVESYGVDYYCIQLVAKRDGTDCNFNFVVKGGNNLFYHSSATSFRNKLLQSGLRNFFWMWINSKTYFGDPYNPSYKAWIEAHTELKITESRTKTLHKFWGTVDANKLAPNVFLVDPYNMKTTVENMYACLLNNQFLSSKFEIECNTNLGDLDTNYWGIEIHPKSDGADCNFEFEFPYDDLFIKKNQQTFINSSVVDSIGKGNEIEIELFADSTDLPGTFGLDSIGRSIVRLSKTFIDRSVWFDLNTILNTQKMYSSQFLLANTWCDAGTATPLRFVAKCTNGVSSQMFYLSRTSYAITGYMRNLEINNLEKQDCNYVFDVEQVQDQTYTTDEKNNDQYLFYPLTLQPKSTHIEGQSQYFNFILGNRGKTEYQSQKIGIIYGLYTQSGVLLGDVVGEEMEIAKFNIVNTIKLNIDNEINNHAKRDQIGMVKVYLSFQKDKNKPPVRAMRPLTFRILPKCLNRVNDFAFLNSLGGWSAFNFGGDSQTEFKSKTNTIHCTQTPNHSISSEIESVYSKEIDEQFVVETAPLQASMIDWLKEISASPAVFELSTMRYIVVDDLTVKHSTKDELFVVQMKYHYSDTYNATTK